MSYNLLLNKLTELVDAGWQVKEEPSILSTSVTKPALRLLPPPGAKLNIPYAFSTLGPVQAVAGILLDKERNANPGTFYLATELGISGVFAYGLERAELGDTNGRFGEIRSAIERALKMNT